MKLFLKSILRLFAGFLIGIASLMHASFSMAVTLPNDNFDAAITIPSSAAELVRVEAVLDKATREPGEPIHFPDTELGSIWYTWLAPVDYDFLLDIQGSDPNVWVAVYLGSALTNLTWVGDSYSYNLITAKKGQMFYFAATTTRGDLAKVQITLYPVAANDHFADALELVGSHVLVGGANIGATREPGEPGQMPSIWFRWTAPESGTAHFGIVEPATKCAVFIGTLVSNLQVIVDPVSYVIPGRTYMSSWWTAHKGVTYHIQCEAVDTSRQSIGLLNGGLLFHPLEVPSNDNFTNRSVITALTNRFVFTNLHASSEIGEPAGGGQTVWWEATVPARGTLTLRSQAIPSGRPAVRLYRGSELHSLKPVETPVRQLDSAVLEVTPGDVYQIQLDFGIGTGAPERIELEIDFTPAATNDHFENAVLMSGSEWRVQGHTHGATLQGRETAFPPSMNGGRSIWYRWTAPETSRSAIAGRATHGHSSIVVFQGSSIDTAEPVRMIAHVDTFSGAFLAKGGVDYYVRVDTWVGSEVEVLLLTEPLGSLTQDAFGSPPPTNSLMTVSGATLEPGEPLHFDWPRQKSIWFNWPSHRHGVWTLTPGVGHSLAPHFGIAVYVGDRVDALQLVAKGTNTIRIPVKPEKTYRIAVVVPEETEGDVLILMDVKSRWDPPPQGVNLICNGDFSSGTLEPSFSCWEIEGTAAGVYVREFGGVRGTGHRETWPAFSSGATLKQILPTTPGETYQLRFAFSGVSSKVRVTWEGQEIALPEFNGGPSEWSEITRLVNASQSGSELKFENLGEGLHLDAISVVRMDAPPSFLEPPASASVRDGGIHVFQPRIAGAEPLTFQWWFNDLPYPGGTNDLLVLEPVRLDMAGIYRLAISNSFGSATSAPVELVVEPSSELVLVMQPRDTTVPLGAYASLSALASGTPPLQYQWFSKSGLIEGQTNRQLVFASTLSADSGFYRVQVSNKRETVSSIWTQLKVTDSVAAGGYVSFRNRFVFAGEIVVVRIFDVDGVTGLTGASFLAQLYAGPSIAELQACGQPVPFDSGVSSGIFRGANVRLPNLAPNQIGWVQIRAWEARAGVSYEEARALGGKYGVSDVLSLTAAGETQIPPSLIGLRSFSLRTGQPRFNVGSVQFLRLSERGAPVVRLLGEPGFRYVLEDASWDFRWKPVAVLTNVTGEVYWESSETAASSQLKFYRSRILD